MVRVVLVFFAVDRTYRSCGGSHKDRERRPLSQNYIATTLRDLNRFGYPLDAHVARERVVQWHGFTFESN